MNPAINVHSRARKPNQNRDRSDNKRDFEEGVTPSKKRKKSSKTPSPKMNPILKIITIIFSIIILFIMLIMGITYYTGSAVINAIDESANEAVTQSITQENGTINIHVPLQKDYGFTIYGKRKCFSTNHLSQEPTTSSSCMNGNCHITVYIDENSAHEVALYVEKGDECVLEHFKVGTNVQVVNYFVKVEMSDELLKLLNITSNEYKIKPLISKDYSSYQIMGSKKATFNYGLNTVTQDKLLIDGVQKANIIIE